MLLLKESRGKMLLSFTAFITKSILQFETREIKKKSLDIDLQGRLGSTTCRHRPTCHTHEYQTDFDSNRIFAFLLQSFLTKSMPQFDTREIKKKLGG